MHDACPIREFEQYDGAINTALKLEPKGPEGYTLHSKIREVHGPDTLRS